MNSHFKITQCLLDKIRSNLQRPHAFAYERVGFISAGVSAADDNLLILARDFHPVEDKDYLPNPEVGALIGAEAINKALQLSLAGNAMFHVHSHEKLGIPRYSKVDLEESAKFVPDFFKVSPHYPHGTVLLSDDSIIGQVWLHPKHHSRVIEEISVIGKSIKKWSVK